MGSEHSTDAERRTKPASCDHDMAMRAGKEHHGAGSTGPLELAVAKILSANPPTIE
jgi:hypothetical protein